MLLMELHLIAMECHLAYGIAQCCLPPDTSKQTPVLTPERPVIPQPKCGRCHQAGTG